MNSPVIFITGAGKGIGEACVKDLICRSMQVAPQAGTPFRPKLFLTSRTKSDLESLADQAKQAKLEVAFHAADLAEQPLAAFESLMKTYGRVDVVLHAAGVGRFGGFLESTPDDLRFVTKTNIEATFILLQAVYRQMQQQKSGMIQVITSVAAERPFEHSAIYCMSKYAQRGLIDVMRLYGYQDGIRIIDVKPGAALTPMWGAVPKDMSDRMMLPTDVAQAMVDALFIHPRASIEEIVIRPTHGDL